MSSLIEVEVLLSTGARTIHRRLFQINGASSLNHLLQSAELKTFLAFHGFVIDQLKASCWGQKISLGHTLTSNDRIELCRELRVDPKVARRERFEKQGKRGAGLFSLAGKKKSAPNSNSDNLKPHN